MAGQTGKKSRKWFSCKISPSCFNLVWLIVYQFRKMPDIHLLNILSFWTNTSTLAIRNNMSRFQKARNFSPKILLSCIRQNGRHFSQRCTHSPVWGPSDMSFCICIYIAYTPPLYILYANELQPDHLVLTQLYSVYCTLYYVVYRIMNIASGAP